MKKLVTLFLAMLMIFSLVACDGENSSNNDDTSNPTKPSNAPSYDYDPDDLQSMLSFITFDGEAASTAVTTEAEALVEKLGGTYSTYDTNKTAVTDFYSAALVRADELYTSFQVVSVDYFKCVAAQGLDDYDTWDDAMGEFYDGIYDGLLDEMYDALYSGVLDERDDDVEYSDWSNIRSNEYEMWSDTRSDTYEQWSDFRSDVYEFWSDIRSEMWGDDAEGAQDEINNFSKDVEKLLSKVGSNDEATAETTIPDETHDDVVTAGIRPEFKEAMDSYEAFFDEYVEFMKEYMESEDVASMMGDYADMMTQYADTMRALEEIDEDELSTEEALYYSEVMARISQKLLEIA